MKCFVVAAVLACLATSAWAVERHATPQDHPDFAKPQFINRPLDKAYPGVEYNMRPAIKGGRLPYTFALETSPTGMTIDAGKGTVAWRAPDVGGKTYPVTIRVIDADGKAASQAFAVLVSKRGFYFVSPRGDDTTGNGSFEKPWRTIGKANRPSKRFQYPPGAVIYARGGDYEVRTPPVPRRRGGKHGGNMVVIDGDSPKRWIAWPGERPVIDFGWNAERHRLALAEKQRTGARSIDTGGYDCKFYLRGDADGFTLDGFELRNMWDRAFKLVDGVEHATFRRCDMHHLYCEGASNPSFIFTASTKRRGPRGWGIRPEAAWHRNIVIQDNYFHDRIREQGFHGGAMVFYSLRDSLIEDNRIERIPRGRAIADKDSGWGNTYRGNRMSGEFGVLTQGFNENIEFTRNVVDGDVRVGGQRGWVRNIWIHHNTIRGGLKLFVGDVTVPEQLKGAGDFSGPETADTRRSLKVAPKTEALVHVYRNVIAAPSGEGRDGNVLLTIQDGRFFAERFRYVRWDENLVDVKGRVRILYGRYRPWSLMTDAGFDAEGVVRDVKLEATGRLPVGSPHRGRYGFALSDKP